MKQVSIIIPVYNRAATLPRCIASVLAQTIADWELIAVDDCSSDESIQVIESFGDPRIRVLRHEQNRGAGPARNTGMLAAQGTYIAFLDSDDEWLPAKLERQIAALEKTGRDCAFVTLRRLVLTAHTWCIGHRVMRIGVCDCTPSVESGAAPRPSSGANTSHRSA